MIGQQKWVILFLFSLGMKIYPEANRPYAASFVRDTFITGTKNMWEKEETTE